ncbi:ThiF family adenylyltransferase [Schumannella sp. 10F1B-5-1]|uniref:ThiF family adenylyltransferase n=1 Tax=Schumannella sp. 10F1B-5-1 TaxID=2590780 RepID=UPI0011306893|nr:ThiF family adenylyltransferase [Schumannella sp. 10F1B-5-1]TPW72814.1 molybdopterin biosynthesis protein MoeB [Schumannella sp. 10F1B-5-1]
MRRVDGLDDLDDLVGLVAEPGDVDARFARQLALPGFELETQRALQRARVLVIGAGGLGSSVLPALAALGVGTIGIVDDDTVETSNLPRQTIHTPHDVGRLKTTSAAEKLRMLSPTTRVVEHPVRLTAHDAAALVGDYDLLVDGSDNFPTRYLANDIAALLGIPLVWGSVSRFGGQVSAVAPGSPDYRDLFPTPPPPGSVRSCAEDGVYPPACAMTAALMVAEVVKLLGGPGEPLLGRVAIVDALTARLSEVRFVRAPEREPVTALVDYELLCGLPSASEEVTAAALREELDGPEAPALLDVREPWEVDLVALPGAIALPLARLDELAESDESGIGPDDRLVIYCHHGVRSAAALTRLRERGFTRVRHLRGGIDAWATEVDPSMRRY